MNKIVEKKNINVLIFFARREKQKKWFEFWKKNYVKVFSYIYENTIGDAKRTARLYMDKIGYEIIKFDILNVLKEDEYPPGWQYLNMIAYAKNYGGHYRFYGLSNDELAILNKKNEPVEITSRYIDGDNVIIDSRKLPKDLVPIMSYAKQWAICDDVERSKYISQSTFEEKKKFHDAILANFEIIESYCREYQDSIQAPDEVVIFDLMLETFTEISPNMEHRNDMNDDK
ncbi:MAG: hypothetical protein FP814_06940 [Desulfobacterium sp.]|nr:hypothetical protein [Desulfobacterium sp.]MBU4011745.1 hypothetical protein [Pseudomonadota bacterium]MBU4035271.1 hypothetical protein [Pseudomonadota bacterium]